MISAARTIVVPTNTTNISLQYPTQQAGSTLEYAIDVHNQAAFTDSLTSFSVVPSTNDLTVTQNALVSGLSYPDNCKAYFSLSGGTNLKIYDLAFNFVFESGQTFACSAFILIGPVGEKLSNLVVNETTRAMGAEEILQTNIDNETSRAELAEQNNLIAIMIEQERAEGQEASLGGSITSLFGSISGSLTSINSTLSTHATQISANASAIAAEVSRAEGQEASLGGSITSLSGSVTATGIATIAEEFNYTLVKAVLNSWIATMATSDAGLSVGDWWNNGGIPTRVQF